MSEDSFGNAPDNSYLDRPGIPVTTAPESFSSELLDNPRVAKLSREVRRLYGWVGLLTGLSILSIGLLAGLGYWLKLQQDRMQLQLSGVNSYKAEIERLKNLEGRINNLDSQAKILNQNVEALNQQLSKGLPTQIKTVQNDLSSVKASIQSFRADLRKVESNAVTRDQLTQIQRAPVEQNRPAIVTPQPQQNRTVPVSPLPAPPKR